MLNKDSIINNYKVLAEYLDEHYLDLTLRQLRELETKQIELWKLLDGGRRK